VARAVDRSHAAFADDALDGVTTVDGLTDEWVEVVVWALGVDERHPIERTKHRGVAEAP